MKAIGDDVQGVQQVFRKHSVVKRLVFGSFLALMATIFQSAGDLLPGIGYFISPFATLPVVLAAMLSLSMGMMAYILTCLLLFILVPSELAIFPFTTGLLAIGIGAAFSFFKKKISIIVTGALFLTAGLLSLLYLFRFPILGPVVTSSFSIVTTGGMFLFSFFYSWLWVEIAQFFFKKIKPLLVR